MVNHPWRLVPSRRPRAYTSQDLLKRAVTSGISVVLVRFLRDANTARELAVAIAAEVPQCLRRHEVEPDVVGYAIRFHLIDHAEPPPDWQVVEDCARRLTRLEHIVPTGYQP